MSQYDETPLGMDEQEARLWEYIDGLATPEESGIISNLIATQAEWNAKYQELLGFQTMMQDAELEEPSMRFTKNVMDQIARLQIAPATKSYINNNVIRGLAFFFITMIVGFIIYGVGQIEWTSGTDNKLPFDFREVDYSKFFNNTLVNIFMMINLVLGMFLLDRYLANKRKGFQTNE